MQTSDPRSHFEPSPNATVPGASQAGVPQALTSPSGEGHGHDDADDNQGNEHQSHQEPEKARSFARLLGLRRRTGTAPTGLSALVALKAGVRRRGPIESQRGSTGVDLGAIDLARRPIERRWTVVAT